MIVGAVLVAVTWWLLPEYGADWERTAAELLNGPALAAGVVWPVMQLGTVAGATLVGMAVGAVRRSWSPPLIAFGAAWASVALADQVKAAAGRGRPEQLDVLVVVHDHATGAGYPSSHTAVATALVVAFLPRLRPRAAAALVVAAAGVGLARIIVGVHLPLDVLGGAAVGLLVGGTLNLVVGVPRAPAPALAPAASIPITPPARGHRPGGARRSLRAFWRRRPDRSRRPGARLRPRAWRDGPDRR